MAKQLVFQAEKIYPFSFTKLDRKKLYGWKDIIAVAENGEECIKADIDASGSFIIPKGGTALGTLDNEGKWVDKKSLNVMHIDGTPAHLIPSTFDQPVELKATVPIEEFLDHCIESVYILNPEENSNELIAQIRASEAIFTFPFNYHASYESSSAFLIENKGTLFVLIGYKSEFDYIGLDEIAEFSTEETEEEGGEETDDIDFGMM